MVRTCSGLLGGDILLEGSGVCLLDGVDVSLKLAMQKLGPPLVDPTILFSPVMPGKLI